MAASPFATYQPALTQSAAGLLTVTPSDSVALSTPCRAVYVGTAGNVSLLCWDGSSATMTNVPAGTVLAVLTTRVNATGTTASGIVGLI